jgi:hypothetical protein
MDRRQAARDTWLRSSVEGVECVFFVGSSVTDGHESDVVALDVDDGYAALPSKVVAFFRWALEHSDFEWLFKCDDDTYVCLERLQSLVPDSFDLVGDESVEARGAPSGGAGYLLSRRFVERLCADAQLPMTGAEDLIVGEAAARYGSMSLASPLLSLGNDKFPSRGNQMVSSHWCSPGRLRTIHAMLSEEAYEVAAHHPCWEDRLVLCEGGLFSRASTACSGSWRRVASGRIRLDWFDWDPELLVPRNEVGFDLGSNGILPHYDCMPLQVPPLDDAMPRSDEAGCNGHPSDEVLWPQASQSCRGTVAVCLTTAAYGLPHVDRFLLHNPGVPFHVISNSLAPEGLPRACAWRNSDRLIRKWWAEVGSKLDFDHAVFMEWDVLFSLDLASAFPDDVDFYCKDRKKPGDPWNWFSEVARMPPEFHPHATGIAPLSVTRFSRRCLADMFSHAGVEELYSRDIFCELRLATLASACGYEPVECEALTGVDLYPCPGGPGRGIWHPVKSRATHEADALQLA